MCFSMTRFKVPISFQSEVTAFFWAAVDRVTSRSQASWRKLAASILRSRELRPCHADKSMIFSRDGQKSDLQENHGNFNKNPQNPLIKSFTSSYIRIMWWWWCQLMLDDSWCMFNSIICWEPLAIWPWWRPPSTSFRNRFAHVSLRDFWNVHVNLLIHSWFSCFASANRRPDMYFS